MKVQILASSTEASICYKKVLLSSDNSTGQPVYSVAPFDRDGQSLQLLQEGRCDTGYPRG